MRFEYAFAALCIVSVRAAGSSSSGQPCELHLQGKNHAYDGSPSASDSFLAWSPFHLGETASGTGEYLDGYGYQPVQSIGISSPPHSSMPQSTSHHLFSSDAYWDLPQQPYTEQRETLGRDRSLSVAYPQDTLDLYQSAGHDVLSQIINRPHMEDAHITGVNDRQRQSSDDEIEENAEEDEGDHQDVVETVVDPIRTPPLPNLTKKEMRALFEQKWHEMGLSFTLPANELALRVGEMKLMTGFVDSMGRIASKLVRKMAPNEDYIDLYRLYSGRYTRKLQYLRKKYRRSPQVTSIVQRDRLLWNNFRKILPKDYLNDGVKMQPSRVEKRVRSKKERHAVWANFVRERILARDDHLDVRSLSIKLLEQYSRDYVTRNHRRRETTEIIKTHLMRDLGKSQADIDEFTLRRLEFRIGTSTTWKAIRRMRLAQNEDVDDIDEMLEEMAEDEAYLDADEIE